MAHLHNNLYLLGKGVVHHQRISSAEGGVCHVYLIGTAHSTQESCKDVSDVIKFIKPKIVFMELCDERYTEMLSEENFQVQTLKNLFCMWIKGRKTLIDFLYCWYLMKRGGIKKMLAESEFKAAYDAAKEIDAKLVPGGRSLKKTLDRLWARMTIMEKVMMASNYFFKILFQSREHENEYKGIYDEDIELLNSFPPAYETLAEEHHMYMAHNLWKEVGQCSSLVAVLERSHLNRIRRYWHIEFLVEAVIVTVKEHSSSVKKISSVGAVIVTFIGIYLWRKN